MFKEKICSLLELKNTGFIRRWSNEFKDEIIIFMKNNKIYAKSSICPHFGGTISYNKNNDYLFCDWHGLKFNLDGKCLNHKNFKVCLNNYDYELKNNNVYIIKK